MKKAITILITMMLVSITIASISGAEELEGEINIQITDTFGLVSPRIQLEENQTFGPLNVEDDNGTLYVNDTLSIHLNITDVVENRYLPRFMLTSVVIIRDPTTVKLVPILTYLKRLIPVRMIPNPLTKQGLIDVSAENYLNISMNYIVNETVASENMTMHIFVMGFPMGDVNGFYGIKFVDHMKVNLRDVTYNIP